jgi:hypothetical protein
LILQGVVDLSSWLHGGVRLVYVGDYARAHIESSELGVYDSDGTSYLSCSCGSCIPYPGGGYVVECSVFYERGFGAPPHRFLYLLLQFYGFELHHFTPLGNLHIAAFITLCEAYMGIEPHFNLWNYFFRVWLRPDSDVEAMVWGCTNIYVRTGQGSTHTSASRYPIQRSGDGKNGSSWGTTPACRSLWLRVSAPPSSPVEGYRVARKDIHKLQPVRHIL